jgi:hypothetical protein
MEIPKPNLQKRAIMLQRIVYAPWWLLIAVFLIVMCNYPESS